MEVLVFSGGGYKYKKGLWLIFHWIEFGHWAY